MVSPSRLGNASEAMREAVRRGTVALRADRRFNGVKVFSAIGYAQRDSLDEQAIAWIDQHPELELVDITVAQSSAPSFHYMAIVITYWQLDRV